MLPALKPEEPNFNFNHVRGSQEACGQPPWTGPGPWGPLARTFLVQTPPRNPSQLAPTPTPRLPEEPQKLSVMEGQKFYFARTESMCRRAADKVAKASRQIEVVHLAPQNAV